MIDHLDMLIHLKVLLDWRPVTVSALYNRWITFFDAFIFVIVDCGSDLAAELKKEKLHEVESQFVPILTELSWGIGFKERSLHYLFKSIDRPLLKPD